MNTQLDDQITSGLQTLVDQTPDLGNTPTGDFLVSWDRSPSWKPMLSLAAATVAVVAVGLVAINRSTPSEQPADAPATASQPIADPTPTTAVPEVLDLDDIPAQAQAWFDAVDTTIADLDWNVPNRQQIPGEGDPFGAAVFSEIAEGRIVFDVQAFFPGEYSDDPLWQSGVAGTNEPGTAVPEGTLFTDDQLSRSATIVTPHGIVMVMAYGIPTSDLPDPDVFVDSARQLAAALPDIIAAI